MVSTTHSTKKILAICIIAFCMIAGAFLLFPNSSEVYGLNKTSIPPISSPHIGLTQQLDAIKITGYISEPKIIDITLINTTAKPEDDLYLFANGNWINSYSLPSDYDFTIWSSTEDIVNSRIQVFDLISEIEKKKESGSSLTDNEIKIYDFYKSGVTVDEHNDANAAEVQKILDMIKKAKTKQDVQAVSIEMTKYGLNPFFSFTAELNGINPQYYEGTISLTGSTIPKEYFSEKNRGTADFPMRYRQYIKNCLRRAGYSEENLDKNAWTVYSIDQKLRNTKTGNYITIGRSALDQTCSGTSSEPAFSWVDFREQAGVPNINKIRFKNNEEINQFCSIFRDSSVEELKAYLVFTTMNKLAPYRSKSDYKEWFGFYSYLYGQEQMKPWNFLVLTKELQILNDLVAPQYIKAYLTPNLTARAIVIRESVRDAYLTRLTVNSWISDDGRAAVAKKIEKMNVNIVPEKFVDYSDLEITDEFVVKNILETNYYNYYNGNKGITRITSGKDDNIWPINLFFNDYYFHTYNSVYISPTSLQAPMFKYDNDPAVQYAYLGWLIAHEMGHGLDSNGIYYDENGISKKILSSDDLRYYNWRKEDLIEQFKSCRVNDEIAIDSSESINEIIADLSGLNVAYDAYRQTEPDSFSSKDTTGYTGEQRFFIAYAQMKREKYSENAGFFLRYNNPHPMENCRVSMIVENMPEFYRAFGVDPATNGMAAIEIW